MMAIKFLLLSTQKRWFSSLIELIDESTTACVVSQEQMVTYYG
jgi:hypothetical protein